MRIDDKRRKRTHSLCSCKHLKGGIIFNKMGEPQMRLNPKVESCVNRILLTEAMNLLLSVTLLLPIKITNKRGAKAYDYRDILALCILRILLRKTYDDYEIEMRTDPRICRAFEMQILPGKSTIQRGMELLTMNLLWQINLLMLRDIMKQKLDILIDSSGIRIFARSIWFCLRIKRDISKRECDKVHIAVCSDLLLVMNWRITNGRRNDSPFFRILIAPIRMIGYAIADKGYLARVNFQAVADKGGQGIIPFKKGKKKKSTNKPKGFPAWKYAHDFWTKLNGWYMSIYHRRSRIESVFSAIKKRYGDKLDCRSASMRRKEMSLRLIAYNIRILLYSRYAKENNLSLYKRVEHN
jgi:hypothetical protein